MDLLNYVDEHKQELKDQTYKTIVEHIASLQLTEPTSTYTLFVLVLTPCVDCKNDNTAKVRIKKTKLILVHDFTKKEYEFVQQEIKRHKCFERSCPLVYKDSFLLLIVCKLVQIHFKLK